MKTKNLTVNIKSDGDGLSEGQFTGYASVFDNVDSYGDVVRKGAFEESLKSFGENGSGIPCYWSHQMSDPQMWIGKTLEAREDDHGLFVKVQLNTDTPNGQQVHRMIKEGVVNQMSFAFDIEDYAFAESDELGTYMELRKMKLHEVSVVQVGANQATELLDVKDRLTRLKVGDGEDHLRQASNLIDQVLSSLEAEPKGAVPSKDSGADPETPEPHDAGQVQAKSGGHPDLALANIQMIALEGA